jgi:uncharacterized membrane protein
VCQLPETLKTERLYFIDALRAFAIIMMMQGHFVDTLLDPVYKDAGRIYTVWEFFRGITAPTFFTISGFVFIYLLLKISDPAAHKQRIKKGVKRGLLLVVLGYTLRVPIMSWLSGSLHNSFLVVDVLHCIGLSLLVLIGLYYLSFKNKWVMMLLTFIIWCGLFLTEPLYRNASFNDVPLALSNYMTRINGSVFTMIPWFGFASFGAFMAIVFNIFQGSRWFKPACITILLLLAVFLSQYSSAFLNDIYLKTDVLLFKQVAYYNYLFQRLGHVLFLFVMFYALNSALKAQWILKVGQKTLSIYVLHFVILYGSFTGLGMYQLTGATLSPWAVTIGASLFVVGISILSVLDFKSNKFFYAQWKKLLDLVKRRWLNAQE